MNALNPNQLPRVSFPAKRLKDLVNTMSLVSSSRMSLPSNKRNNMMPLPSCEVLVKFGTDRIVFRLCKDDHKLPVFFNVRMEFLLRYEPPIELMKSGSFQLPFGHFQRIVTQAPDDGIVGISDHIVVLSTVLHFTILKNDGGYLHDETLWGAKHISADLNCWDYNPDIQIDHSFSVPADEFTSLVAFSTEHHLPVKVELCCSFARLSVEGSNDNLTQPIAVNQTLAHSAQYLPNNIRPADFNTDDINPDDLIFDNIFPDDFNTHKFHPADLNPHNILPPDNNDNFRLADLNTDNSVANLNALVSQWPYDNSGPLQLCSFSLSLYAAPYIQYVSSTATTVKIKFLNPTAEQTVPTVIMMDQGQHTDVEFCLNSESIVQPRLIA